MITFIITVLVSAAAGFVAGLLVGRANKKKVELGVDVAKNLKEKATTFVDNVKTKV